MDINNDMFQFKNSLIINIVVLIFLLSFTIYQILVKCCSNSMGREITDAVLEGMVQNQ